MFPDLQERRGVQGAVHGAEARPERASSRGARRQTGSPLVMFNVHRVLLLCRVQSSETTEGFDRLYRRARGGGGRREGGGGETDGVWMVKLHLLVRETYKYRNIRQADITFPGLYILWQINKNTYVYFQVLE